MKKIEKERGGMKQAPITVFSSHSSTQGGGKKEHSINFFFALISLQLTAIYV